MSRQSHLDAVHSIVLGSVLSRRTTDAQARHLKRFGERHHEWWQHENVVGLCIARKRRNGGFGQACVQVLVEKKMPGHKLDKRHKVPETLKCPAFSRELVTDVRAVGKARLEALVTATRPARPGYSLGNELGGSGTLSCVVKERTTGKRLGLSCAHVIAPGGASSVGAAVGGAVYCPSLANAEDLDVLSEAPIGTLYRVAPFGFDESDAATNVDAAVFEPDAPNLLDIRVAQLGASPKGVNSKPTVGLRVHKVGAVSEQTYGSIQAIGLCAKVTYEGSPPATFIDQIGITSFARPGDSGALVLDDNGFAVGMHFASFEGMSLCTPISRVLEALDCVLA
jgi:hypothetical protein